MAEQRVYTQYERENVGAGDYMVQRMQMMHGPDRWAVVRYTGRMYVTEYTLPTRSAAAGSARTAWRRVLKELDKRRYR